MLAASLTLGEIQPYGEQMALKDAYMRCEVTPGMFPSEYSVTIPMGEDDYAYSWVDNHNVIITSGQVNREETNPQAAKGWVRVVVMEERPDATLVTLPYDSFTSHRTFLVDPQMVEYNPG